MRSFLIGFAAGVCGLQVQARLPGLSAMLLLCSACLLLAAGIRGRRFPVLRMPAIRLPLLLLCGLGCGFLWAALYAHYELADALPKEMEGRDITIIGTVDSLPYHLPQGARFNFAVERVVADGLPPPSHIPRKLALSWYAYGGTDDASEADNPEVAGAGTIRPGERWQLKVRLQRPHGNADPGSFDYEVWLLEQGVRATGSVRGDAKDHAGLQSVGGEKINRRLDAFVPGFSNSVERCRGWLRDRILAALPGEPYAGVIVALVIGDERGVGQRDWQIFNRAGIGHLVVISGLHITLIAAFFARLMHWFWRRSFFIPGATLPALMPAPHVALLTAAIVAFIYVLLAGFGVPAQRTMYMLMVAVVAAWLGRIGSISHIMCIALGLVVLLDPWSVLSPGFWLSFVAVAAILYASVGRMHRDAADLAKDMSDARVAPTPMQRRLAWLKEEVHTQYVITLGLVPLSVMLFSQVSVVGPIANALAIPLISFVVTPLALVGSVLPAPLSGWVLHFAHWWMAWLAQLLGWMTRLPGAVWSAPQPAWWMLLLASAGTLWLLAPRGWPQRWLGLLCWLPLACNQPTHPPEGAMHVVAFDVGQGMALLVETAHHRMIYDTGPAYSPESDGGNRVILPYLNERGIDHLDGMVLSHNDSDHSGGALSIIAAIPIGWTDSSLAYDSPIVRAAPHHRRCVDGQTWSWDGVQFEILQPEAVSYESTKWRANALSCTLKITAGGHSMLMAGDIEAVQEDELVNRIPQKLQATVLLAPHHGSGTSSTLPFLQAVKPQVAIFQMGYRNRYHHPKPEVYQRYGALGVKRLRSDESGMIELEFGAQLTIDEYRIEHARYWYGQ